MKLKKIIGLALIAITSLLIVACASVNKTGNVYEADIIVYGGTSGAVTSAIQSAREGKSVILVSPDKHLGAMSSAGLTFTDSGRAYTIGGISREFYRRIYEEYQNPKAWNWLKLEDDNLRGQNVKAIKHDDKTMWIFEPKVAERVFDNWIAEEKNITLFREKLLDRESGVKKDGTKIVSIRTLDGDVFKGKMFIDATFEGDLMAASGCSYHVGREANSVYNENWNGAQPGVLHHDHYFYKDTDPYKIKGDKSSGLMKYISDKHPGEKGQGDEKVQAYCFRLCMSIVPENMRPFPKPDNYNADDYLLVLRTWDMEKRRDTMKPDRIPNGKTDTNNKSAFGFDFIGQNYAYPDASYEERAKIIKAHKDYQQGLLYFIMNDPRVDPDLRSFYAPYGLAKDEFVDNDNWPYNLYIREARRMIGEYVMTEHDCRCTKETPKSIGMGSYTLDSHNCQRYITPQGFVQNEGDIGVHLKKPYKISYGALTPKRNEVSNLLVPVACSASHIAYGSIRMEPVFMLLGHSSATAA
ncbi:MAG: FAD-dependent oxidoreductase, partial [Opitutales bacterium]|nr:FAD-dependent oxidoreductase [Opitutales bacterium]